MENKPEIEADLRKNTRSFLESIRERRRSADPRVQSLMQEVNEFTPKAKSYLSYLTNIFLERDRWETIMGNPNSAIKIRRKLLKYGATPEQTDSILDYFASSHRASLRNQEPSDIP